MPKPKENKGWREKINHKLQNDLWHMANKSVGKEAFNTTLNRQYNVIDKYTKLVESETVRRCVEKIKEYKENQLPKADMYSDWDNGLKAACEDIARELEGNKKQN